MGLVRTLSLFRELVDLNESHPERIKAMLPRFMDYVVWREENGAGTLEVALFPRPFLAPEDSTLKMMLKDLIGRHEAEACGSAMSLVRGRLSIRVPPDTRCEPSRTAHERGERRGKILENFRTAFTDPTFDLQQVSQGLSPEFNKTVPFRS